MTLLTHSELVQLIGLAKAAVSNYEAHRARLLAESSGDDDARQLCTFYAREIDELGRMLCKLDALRVTVLHGLSGR